MRLLLILLGFMAMQLVFVSTQNTTGAVARYRMTVENNWIADLYPIAYPAGAHFSWLAGVKHDSSQSFWSLGGMATKGFQVLAETGYSEEFLKEVQAPAVPFGWQHWFCSAESMSPKCDVLTVEFTMTSNRPLITLASMLGPSPDWFVGVSGLSLRPDGNWIEELTVPLVLYDAGTEDGLEPTMTNPESNPHMPISLIIYDKKSGKYISSEEGQIVGKLIFELLSVSE